MKKIGIFSTILLSFCLSIALFAIVTHTNSPDTWLRMRIGKQIVENRRIPQHSDLSFKKTEPSLELISHSWLSDSILYLSAFKNIQLGSLFILVPLFLFSVFALYSILAASRISYKGKLLSILIGILIAPFFWTPHPLTFLTPLTLWLIFELSKLDSNNGKGLIRFPIIFVLMSNLAGGFIFIPLALVIFYVLTKIAFKLTGQYKNIKLIHLLALLFLSIIAILCNPYGFRIILYLFTFLGVIEFKSYFSTLTGALSIINQSFIKQSISSTYYIFYVSYLLFSISALVLLVARKRGSILVHCGWTISLFPFFFLPFLWIRFIPISVFITLPFFAKLFEYIYENYVGILRTVLYSTLLVFIMCGFVLTAISFSRRTQSTLPYKQLKFIESNNLSDNVFTTSDFTAYASYELYPRKLHLDAQDDLFDDNETIDFFHTVSYIPEGTYKSIFEDNEINTALTSKELANIGISLNANKDWALVYFESDGYVFVRKDSANPDFLNKNELQYVNLSNALGFDSKNIEKAKKELENYVKREPDAILARGQLATIYRLQNNLSKALKTLDEIPLSNRDYVINTELGRLYAALGKCAEAEQYLLLAINDRGEQNFSRAVLDLGVLYAGCLNNKEKAQHYFERYNSYVLPSIERLRLIQVAKDFDITLEDQ